MIHKKYILSNYSIAFIGYKLTRKQLLKIEENMKSNHNTNDGIDQLTDNKIKAISNTFENINTNISENNIILNVNIFVTNVRSEQKDDIIEKKYSFGYTFKYWKGCIK